MIINLNNCVTSTLKGWSRKIMIIYPQRRDGAFGRNLQSSRSGRILDQTGNNVRLYVLIKPKVSCFLFLNTRFQPQQVGPVFLVFPLETFPPRSCFVHTVYMTNYFYLNDLFPSWLILILGAALVLRNTITTAYHTFSTFIITAVSLHFPPKNCVNTSFSNSKVLKLP